MPSKNIIGTPLKKLWYTWRSHRFPWRKTYFIGMDLSGNTFWEYRDRLAAHRPRRSVTFSDPNLDWVDYASAVSPAWHQWLRATRVSAPTIEEQREDTRRQEVLAVNAARADARWEAMPSLVNAPPHPPRDSVIESNTKFANDSGLQRPGGGGGGQGVGRGEVGAEVGGKDIEGHREAGEKASSPHGLRGDKDPWAEAEIGRARGFKQGEWDPNANLPRVRSRGRSDR
ncbi:hypothetical protein BZA05DRAFT_380075 [Tricharina praecox]|uniref:uncharacterized protein n=1 Tax=Tricharina praecox TaxID=43433 RepID=UPI00221FE848|nr:uncharacterized protein BZA05DRAFT_380075 [Tricharina praecox]KAI5842246.1 hypothetical protein BZA05DRAFT_380075 [Tricharina praecox]